jgi:hypothetical protein
MADAIVYPVKAPEVRPKLVAGRFYPNGTSTSALSFEGEGVSGVVRTASAGIFTVTLKDGYASLISAVPGVQHVTAVDLTAQFGAFENLGTTDAVTFTMRLVAGATGTDMTGDADSSVSFMCLFNDSGAQE